MITREWKKISKWFWYRWMCFQIMHIVFINLFISFINLYGIFLYFSYFFPFFCVTIDVDISNRGTHQGRLDVGVRARNCNARRIHPFLFWFLICINSRRLIYNRLKIPHLSFPTGWLWFHARIVWNRVLVGKSSLIYSHHL